MRTQSRPFKGKRNGHHGHRAVPNTVSYPPLASLTRHASTPVCLAAFCLPSVQSRCGSRNLSLSPFISTYVHLSIPLCISSLSLCPPFCVCLFGPPPFSISLFLLSSFLSLYFSFSVPSPPFFVFSHFLSHVVGKPENLIAPSLTIRACRKAVDDGERQKFLERVRSFKLLTWFGKASELSPLACARYGWINSATDTLTCPTCESIMYCGADNGRGIDAEDAQGTELSRHYQAGLVNSHTAMCLWRKKPCPGG